MAYVGKQRSGKGSRVSVGGTALNMADWNATRKADDLDTVNFECLGEDQGTVGISSTDWDLKGDWDAGRNFFDAVPGLYPRDDLASLRFFENVADNVGWLLTLSRVLSSKNGASVRQKVTFESQGKSNGGATIPTGSV